MRLRYHPNFFARLLGQLVFLLAWVLGVLAAALVVALVLKWTGTFDIFAAAQHGWAVLHDKGWQQKALGAAGSVVGFLFIGYLLLEALTPDNGQNATVNYRQTNVYRQDRQPRRDRRNDHGDRFDESRDH